MLALGMFSESPQQEQRYAELYAQQEFDLTERTLQFQQAYQSAFERLYPNTTMLDQRLLAPYFLHQQKKSAMPLINNWLDEMDKLRREHAPLYQAAFSKFYKEITPILTPEQLVELDKMQKRFNRHKKKTKENSADSSTPAKKGEENVSK